ncbi:MAG: alpha/beta hydrolase [Rectinemataceae bacterium]
MESGVLAVNGMSMFFIAAGAGLPVLYIHGNTGSSRWWSRVMELPGYRTIAVDMPNFGASSPLEGEPDLHAYAEAVAGFMEAMGLASAVVAGHSLGGAVAQALAIRHPDKVRALVLVDSGAPTGLVTPKERYPLIELMRMSREVLEKALQAVVSTLEDKEFFRELVDDAQKMAPRAWVGNAEALSRFDISAQCANYRGPVLVLRGELDPIITAAMAEETARAYPNARLISLQGVGHSIIVEKPALFLKIMQEYLAEIGVR